MYERALLRASARLSVFAWQEFEATLHGVPMPSMVPSIGQFLQPESVQLLFDECQGPKSRALARRFRMEHFVHLFGMLPFGAISCWSSTWRILAVRSITCWCTSCASVASQGVCSCGWTISLALVHCVQWRQTSKVALLHFVTS